MSNFITCGQWPIRRIIGALLVVISLALAPDAFAEAVATGNGIYMIGHILGIGIWGYILFLLLQAPDEPKTWKSVPHSWLAVLLYFAVVFLMGSSSYGKLLDARQNSTAEYGNSLASKAQLADECVARKIAAKMDMTNAAEECMSAAGISAEEQRMMMTETINMGDRMSIPEREEWCKKFLSYSWKDPSTLDTACNYAATHWKEAKEELLRQLNGGPSAVSQ